MWSLSRRTDESGKWNFFVGANDYTGDTTISAGGTLQLTGTLSDSTDVINSELMMWMRLTRSTLSDLHSDLASGIVLSAGDALNHEISGVVTGWRTDKDRKWNSYFVGSDDYTGDTTISAGGTLLTGTLSDSTDVINSRNMMWMRLTRSSLSGLAQWT